MDDPRIEKLLAELTVDEKAGIVSGSDMWRTPPVDRLGIPQLKVSDGPVGARGGTLGGEVQAASFPCGIALGATWNVELIGQVGRALGQECKTKGAQVLLGPTVNLHRHPLGGRHFECYSEDPVLSAEIGVAWIRGVQAEGVGACVKHYVCNDSEYERHSISSEIAERPLRELYLLPFEHAVKRAQTWSLMGSYNRVNGPFACEHELLLKGVLKGEWAWDGAVISDWYAVQDGPASARNGLDLEMPGRPVTGERTARRSPPRCGAARCPKPRSTRRCGACCGSRSARAPSRTRDSPRRRSAPKIGPSIARSRGAPRSSRSCS